MWPPKYGFQLSFSRYGFLHGRNLKTIFGTLFSRRKVSTHLCHLLPCFPQKWSCPLKIIFRRYFGKYCFFQKNSYMRNFQNLILYKKCYTDSCRHTHPSPYNGHVLPQMVFPNFSQKYYFFQKICFVIKYPVPNS